MYPFTRICCRVTFSLPMVSGLLLLILMGVLAFAAGPGRAAPSAALVPDVVRSDRFDQAAFAGRATRSVNASQHWATLMCRFSDVGSEPQDAAFFNDMFERSTGPSLSDYWNEVSYGNIPTITTDVHGWFTLPHDRSYYGFSETTAGYDVTSIVQDCVDAADASVDFTPYGAVAVILNSPSPVAITTLYPIDYPDGAQIYLGAITIPSNKYNLALVAHEMGHAYGLPHSSANGAEYQNPWDLMGIASGYRCSVNADPVYSCLGQHTIAHYKDGLGWIPPTRKFQAPQGESTITLERLALPQTDNYLMATVGTGSDTYTVEARQRVGYDAKLAGDAVIIHRGSGDDLVDNDGSPYDDAGAMWLPGETYVDAAGGISIRVDSATATGFVVTINNDNEPLQIMKATLTAAPTAPAANDQVDFQATLTYEDPGFGSATNLVVTATLPAELTYLPGSALVNGGTIVSEDPLVVEVGTLLSWLPFWLDYSATVNGDVTEPASIQVPLDVRWDGGTLSTARTLILNGETAYFPMLLR